MKFLFFILFLFLPIITEAQKLSKKAQKAVNIIENLGNLNRALSILKKEIIKDPNNAIIYYYMGEAKSFTAPDYGLEYYNKAIELDSTFFEAYVARAFILDDPQAALNDMNKAIELNPNEVSYYFYKRAELKLEVNDYEGAIADADKSYQLNPYGFQDIFVTKADALSNLGRHLEALKELERIEEFMDNVVDFHIVYGEVLQRLGDGVSACEHFHLAEVIVQENTTDLPEKLAGYLNNCK